MKRQILHGERRQKEPKEVHRCDNTKRNGFILDHSLEAFLGKHFFHLKLSEKSSDLHRAEKTLEELSYQQSTAKRAQG